jgi:zinc protease
MDEVDPDVSYQFYKNRFADASDFTFFFVGNFLLDEIKPHVESYLGSLPSLNRQEIWKDLGILPPEGVVSKSVQVGIEPKSLVRLYFPGKMEWSEENTYLLNSLANVLRIKLREIMREDLSGTYGVRVWASSVQFPRQQYSISISFGCSPDRVDEMLSSLFKQIRKIQSRGPDDRYLVKVRESQKREFETNLEDNSFWLQSLLSSYYNGQDPEDILKYPQMIQKLNRKKVRDAAIRYFNMDNYVQIVLYPEEMD